MNLQFLARRTSVAAFVIAALAVVAPPGPLVCGDDSPGLVAARPDSGPAIEVDGGFMVPYVETIPGTDISFAMVPIPGGEFLLGSPEDEPERQQDEGPQVRVRVAPFWMASTEVTWNQYQHYMGLYNGFKQLQTLAANPPGAKASENQLQLIRSHAWNGKLQDELDVDAVTSPTPLYSPDSTYMAGDQPEQPAVTMTQFAARQFTKWLSGVTGRQYRLPGEAEWEYAARAGTTAAYSFGDDAGELDQYAWFVDNADYATHPVGSKEPNPWALYDMHGNVAEWTLDQYAADRYQQLGPGPVDAWESINWPTELNPRVIRGGSWLDEAPRLRSAARHKSQEDDWKLSDPNLPLSPWWYTEEPAMGVGMRVVRPLKPLTPEEQRRVWDADVEELKTAVDGRLKEGRGAMGHASPALSEAVKAAKELSQ